MKIIIILFVFHKIGFAQNHFSKKTAGYDNRFSVSNITPNLIPYSSLYIKDTVNTELDYFNFKTLTPPILLGTIGGTLTGTALALPGILLLDKYTGPIIGSFGFVGGYILGTSLTVYFLTKRRLKAQPLQEAIVGAGAGTISGGALAFGVMFTSIVIADYLSNDDILNGISIIAVALLPATGATIGCLIAYKDYLNRNSPLGLKFGVTRNGLGLSFQF